MFAAVAPGDTEKDAETLAAKVLKMRLWDDEAGGRVSAVPPSKITLSPMAVEAECSRHQWRDSLWFVIKVKQQCGV